MRDILIITGRGKRSLEDHFDRSFELEHYLEEGGKFDLLKQMQAIAEMADIHYVRQGEPRGPRATRCRWPASTWATSPSW